MKISYELARDMGIVPKAEYPKLSFMERLNLLGTKRGVLGTMEDMRNAEQEKIDNEYIVDKDLMLVEYYE
ncbi:hypothetical protein N8148_03025 [Gammaproteobacteria bacterium]|nr:hypothetical protein [Gammaproteobacteria bacterium]